MSHSTKPDRIFRICPCTCTLYKLCRAQHFLQPDPEVIKLFSCSTQLSMKFVLLIIQYIFIQHQANTRLLIAYNSICNKLLTNTNSSWLNIAEHENFFANKYENANFCWHFYIFISRENFILSWVEHEKKCFITSEPDLAQSNMIHHLTYPLSDSTTARKTDGKT